MPRFLLPVLAALSALLPSPALAYWEYGHETIAKIARSNVSPRTRGAIARLLAQQKLLGTPECPAGTMETASVWADCVKPLGDRFKYAYNWHFQNVNICKPFDLTTPCKDGNCVSAQIGREVAALKNPKTPRADRVRALVFLIHFVGDLHQPLHAGDRDDLGGNRVKADYGIYGPARFNLHSIWDGPLAERAISTPPRIVRVYSRAERRRITRGSVTDWSRESWAVSRDYAYASALGGDPCGPVPARATLDDATVARLVPVAREQVVRGGLRLARLLDDALGGR